jgi:hypothetical protein
VAWCWRQPRSFISLCGVKPGELIRRLSFCQLHLCWQYTRPSSYSSSSCWFWRCDGCKCWSGPSRSASVRLLAPKMVKTDIMMGTGAGCDRDAYNLKQTACATKEPGADQSHRVLTERLLAAAAQERRRNGVRRLWRGRRAGVDKMRMRSAGTTTLAPGCASALSAQLVLSAQPPQAPGRASAPGRVRATCHLLPPARLTKRRPLSLRDGESLAMSDVRAASGVPRHPRARRGSLAAS